MQSENNMKGEKMLRTLLVAAPVALIALPVWADRHCGPVLESYYQARQAVLDTETSCAAAIETATPRLEAALTNARICGCTPLIEGLEAALDSLLSDPAPEACDDRREAILDEDLDALIKGLVEDCH